MDRFLRAVAKLGASTADWTVVRAGLSEMLSSLTVDDAFRLAEVELLQLVHEFDRLHGPSEFVRATIDSIRTNNLVELSDPEMPTEMPAEWRGVRGASIEFGLALHLRDQAGEARSHLLECLAAVAMTRVIVAWASAEPVAWKRESAALEVVEKGGEAAELARAYGLRVTSKTWSDCIRSAVLELAESALLWRGR